MYRLSKYNHRCDLQCWFINWVNPPASLHCHTFCISGFHHPTAMTVSVTSSAGHSTALCAQRETDTVKTMEWTSSQLQKWILPNLHRMSLTMHKSQSTFFEDGTYILGCLLENSAWKLHFKNNQNVSERTKHPAVECETSWALKEWDDPRTNGTKWVI